MVASTEHHEGDWSADDFSQMEALYIYEASLCNQCGRPLEECRDPNTAVMVDDEVCMFSAAIEVARRTEAAKHEREKPKPGARFWSDGLLLTPRPMTDVEFKQYSGKRRPE